MDKEKDPILKLRRMEGKLLLLDLKKIIWVAPLSWLMMFISLASLLFSEHQSDWKWNISSVTKSIIPFAKQVWADAADHVRPGCSDPLTCLLTFLTLNAAIVVVIVLEGKSRVKGTIELFSSVSIGTSVFILALTGILTPCLIEEYGLILGLLFILFILVWSCILANASRIYSEEERIKRSEKSRRKNLNQRRKFSKINLKNYPARLIRQNTSSGTATVHLYCLYLFLHSCSALCFSPFFSVTGPAILDCYFFRSSSVHC